MRITGIDCHVLIDPDFDTSAASSSQDDFIVEIHTDEGISGVGETDLNPWIARACIEAPSTHNMGLGLRDMLIGADPLAVENLWQRLYVGSAMNGRRGAVINAIGAIDIALHDLRGKALGKPCHELLGGAVRDSITPYASLQPEVSSYSDYRDSIIEWALTAKDHGFRAIKSEITLAGPFAHKNLREPWDKSTELIAAIRAAIGSDIALLVDVQYAFPDAGTALAVLKEWQEFNLTFVETPLWPDDLEGYARLATAQPIPIAAGEWLTTRFEFLSLIDQGNITIAQPDIGRVGGLTESMRVAALAADRGRRIVPHVWKSGISIAAAAHFAAAAEPCDYIEFLPSDLSASALRKNLVDQELAMTDGQIPLPRRPGLGIGIDRDALRYYSDAAKQATSAAGNRPQPQRPARLGSR